MYETFEHTADIGLRVRAADVAELFTDAGRGLFAVILDNPTSVGTGEELPIRLQADSLEDLWRDWLAELLFAFHGRRLVLADFAVDVRAPEVCDEAESPEPAEQFALQAVVQGEPIDPVRHQIGVEVKAITWHQLLVQRTSAGWLGEVILDI